MFVLCDEGEKGRERGRERREGREREEEDRRGKGEVRESWFSLVSLLSFAAPTINGVG